MSWHDNDELLGDANHKIKIDIQNRMNAQYLGYVQIGTYKNNKTNSTIESKPGIVVFDTGSNWLTMTSDKCANCTTKIYDSENSTTNQLVKDDLVNQVYGSANLTGYEYNDTVCLQPSLNVTSKCVQNFSFMAISEAKGLNPGIDGILGLGPNFTDGPSIVRSLKN